MFLLKLLVQFYVFLSLTLGAFIEPHFRGIYISFKFYLLSLPETFYRIYIVQVLIILKY